jgi:hypothetical protein
MRQTIAGFNKPAGGSFAPNYQQRQDVFSTVKFMLTED